MKLVAITRPEQRKEETLKIAAKLSIPCIVVSSIEIKPKNEKEIKKIDLRKFDWLVLTSAIGAEIAYDIFGEELKKTKIAVIGEKTKEKLESFGIKVSLTAKEYVAESLAEELKKVAKGEKILVARAEKARKVLVEELKKVAEVKEIKLYQSSFPEDKESMEKLKELLNEDKIGAIIFTSSEAAKNLIKFLGDNYIEKINKTITCAIGPITKKTLESFGIKVKAMPQKYTVEEAFRKVKKAMEKSGA